MADDRIIEFTLDTTLRDRLMAEARNAQRPAAAILRELVQEYVDRRQGERRYSDWFHSSVGEAMREADDPAHRRRSNEDVAADWARRRANLLKRVVESE